MQRETTTLSRILPYLARLGSVALIVVAMASLAPSSSSAQTSVPKAQMSGFGADGAARQTLYEERFKALIDAQKVRDFHRIFTSEPHPAGSERNNELARYVADTWKEQGLEDVVIRRYDVLNTSPRDIMVEMVSPVKYRAGLREDPSNADPDTRNTNVSSAYTGMSASGEITAPVVYAHSGNPDDYALLRKNGIDVRGKVVLVRYSNPYSYRGFKALTAQREGAAAILIYSDPAEDGYKRGKVFPDGPWGPESHIQRGAITYDFIVPGDPLTPGWASVEGAKRIALEEAASVPKIVAVPLSWRDAKPILENMGGPKAPKTWRGGLPIQYRLGGQAIVHLNVQMNNMVMPNYVVEARIRGSEQPEEEVVLGNHRDAWVFGGVDPSSGTASMMEMTRALGELARQGVRPRRTLVVCSWDGEEVGLTGSTEWGEQFADVLKKNAIAYLNVDSSTSGPNLEVTAVPSLAPLMVEISRTLRDPSGKSLYEAWRSSKAKEGKNKAKRGAITDSDLVDTKIGSGSDHTVFLNYLGRPSVGLTFTGPYGVYHSMYDDFYWINRVGDPGYRYHTLMSQLWGVVALRLANADILPFDFAAYAGEIRHFIEEVQRKKDASRNLDFTSLLQRVTEFETAGRTLNGCVTKALASNSFDAQQADRINREMMRVESNWLHPDGIPGRPWFKHLLYAARYTYAHLELPGVTEAVEKGDWSVAKRQVEVLEAALKKNISTVNDAIAAMPGSCTTTKGSSSQAK